MSQRLLLAWLTILGPTILALATPLLAQDRAAGRKDLPQPDRMIEFKQVGGKSLKLHVFDSPKEPVAPRAAIVFFFGGAWSGGTPSQFYPHARVLADRGMLAICADYRVHSRDKAMVVDCVADAQDALLYVRDHAQELKVDPQRIVAAGGSAGGHLAAAAATLPYRGQSKEVGDRFRPHALVLFNPALILSPLEPKELSPRDALRVAGLNERMGDKPEALSPYHHVTKALPPTLILHGKADTTVSYATAEAFARRARELGADCTLVGYEGQNHGFFNFGRASGRYEATRDEMLGFLEKLGDLSPAPIAEPSR